VWHALGCASNGKPCSDGTRCSTPRSNVLDTVSLVRGERWERWGGVARTGLCEQREALQRRHQVQHAQVERARHRLAQGGSAVAR
jgi:hypothetical protein